MFCENCGTPLSEDQKFCPNCGIPAKKDLPKQSASTPPPIPQPPRQEPQRTNFVPQAPPPNQYQQQPPPSNIPPKKKSHKVLILVLSLVIGIPILLIIAFLILVFIVPDEGSSAATTKNLISSPADQKKQTIMIYMNGADLETDYGLATGDLAEMLDSSFNEDNMNVIVFTGGTTTWQNYDIPSDTNMVYSLKKDEIQAVADMGLSNMGEADTLTNFINFGYEYFPADQYGLILSDHGGGAVVGFGVDELFDYDGFTLDELDNALANSQIASNEGFEFIGFDACLMATLETANILQNYASYMIASEELEPGYGWNYSAFKEISNMESPTGDKIGKCVIDNFLEFYQMESPSDAVTLSLMDLSQTNNAISALETLATAAGSSLSQGNYSAIAKMRGKSRAFGDMGAHGGETDMVDAYNLAEEMYSLCPAESESLIQAVNSLVPYQCLNNIDHANGVSVYFPFADKESAPDNLEVYKTLGFSDTYTNFISDFAETLTGAPISQIDISDVEPEANADGDFQITLSQDELDNISEIYFTLWQQADDGSDYYIQYGEDSNVEIDENGVITTEFDGTWGTLNGNWVCLYELESTDEYAKYTIPAYLNGEDVDLVAVFSDEYPNGTILGAMPVYDTETNMAAKYMIPIEDGDEVTLYYYSELFYVEETDDQEFSTWWEGDTFTVDGSLDLEFYDVDEGSEYLYGFYIVDTQGNGYYTDFIETTFTYE